MNSYSIEKYCVYITIYSGNKLPPFYIGSTTIKRVNAGYQGSIRSKKYSTIFKTEIRENPQLFKTKIVKKYHSRKMALLKEKRLQQKLNVVRSPMYFNQSIATVNGMFGRDTAGELHPLYGIGHSPETCKKLSDNHHDVSGANNPRAKHFVVVTPKMEVIHCRGNIISISESFGLAPEALYNLAYSRNNIGTRQKVKGFQVYSIEDFTEPKTKEQVNHIINKDINSRLYMINKICTCEHCGIQTTPGNISRWHNDNCKSRYI